MLAQNYKLLWLPFIYLYYFLFTNNIFNVLSLALKINIMSSIKLKGYPSFPNIYYDTFGNKLIISSNLQSENS